MKWSELFGLFGERFDAEDFFLGGRMLPVRMEMVPADKPGQKTAMINHVAQFDFDIKTDFFSQANMKELRQ